MAYNESQGNLVISTIFRSDEGLTLETSAL